MYYLNQNNHLKLKNKNEILKLKSNIDTFEKIKKFND